MATMVYHKMPNFIQNLLVSTQGARIRRKRYTHHTWEVFDFLKNSQFWTQAQFESFQAERLIRLVRHAIKHSPYYAGLYASRMLSEKDIKTVSDIKKFPIVSKEEFRENNESIVSTHIVRKRMWAAFTSGTSGVPLKAFFSHENMQDRIAFLERLYHWYSPGKWRKRASFTGKLIVDPEDSSGTFHRYNYCINQQLYSSHHLSENNLARYVKDLTKFAPDQIDGIASAIYVVADYMLRNGQAGQLKPNVVIPTSETIWPHIRERLEKAFGCKMANQYGSQEGAPIAYECPAGGFHISPESGIFEILRTDNSSCKPGEPGRMVVTSFSSEGTPLIRYDIGDVASWRSGTCSCGRHMPMLETIEGRLDDMFFTTERGIVPRIDSAFKGLPSVIIATQIAQVGQDSFEVRIVPQKNGYYPKYADSIVDHLYDYLGASVDIKLKVVEGISRTRGGKLPAMVNEYHDQDMKIDALSSWNIVK